MCELNDEDRRNLLLLISRPETPIKANEALAVAVLQQKLQVMVPPIPEPDGATPNRGERRRAAKT